MEKMEKDIRRHMEKCKRELCQKCDKQDTCNNQFFSLDCPYHYTHSNINKLQ